MSYYNCASRKVIVNKSSSKKVYYTMYTQGRLSRQCITRAIFANLELEAVSRESILYRQLAWK